MRTIKCSCGYKTYRPDNFARHLKRKTSWCNEVDVLTTNDSNENERIITFYYNMINIKKDFVIWIKNTRRVNKELNFN